jgi:AcrR family transcriptional regulator
VSYLAARRQEEKERRRSDILDAAEAVAGRTGVEALTMEEVAREARLSRALLYVYFHDKADLGAALCERALGELHHRFVVATNAAPRGVDKLIGIGRAYVAFARECPVKFEFLARLEARDSSPVTPEGNLRACLAAGDRVHDVMLAALEHGIADGSVSAAVGEPNTVAMSLWALMHGVLQVANLKGGVLASRGVTAQDLVEQALRMAAVTLVKS